MGRTLGCWSGSAPVVALFRIFSFCSGLYSKNLASERDGTGLGLAEHIPIHVLVDSVGFKKRSAVRTVEEMFNEAVTVEEEA